MRDRYRKLERGRKGTNKREKGRKRKVVGVDKKRRERPEVPPPV